MAISTVAIQSPGDMGHGVGRDLVARGFRVICCLEGRSGRSRRLAEAAGLAAVPSLEALVQAADVVLSIIPPAAAAAAAGRMARAMEAAGATPPYVDCNAISPRTVPRAAAPVTEAGASFIDAGIIGPPPGRGSGPTRFYCSGPDTSPLRALHGGGMDVRDLGPELGRASAMKMCYAAVTKGTWSLHAAVLTAAEAYGLSDEYHREVGQSLPEVYRAMNRRTPRLPVVAGRWRGEMREIADALEAVGLPPDFHRGAEAMYALLERTPIAAETPENVDASRTLREAVSIFRQQLPDRA